MYQGIKQEEIIQVVDGSADRMYEYDGKQYPSVTTIIGSVLDKPALTPWAYKTGLEGALKTIQQEVASMPKLADVKDYINNMTIKQLKSDVKALEYDIDSKKQEGGTRGLVVHEWIEAYANGESLPEVDAEYMPYINSLSQWIEDYEPEFVISEWKIVHPALGYAGTFDGLVRIHNHPPRKRHTDLTGKLCLIDYKTNNEGRVYPEQHLPQVEAYRFAYEAMGNPAVDEAIVIGIGPAEKDKAKYQTTVSYATIDIFAPILNYYRQREVMRLANPNGRKK